MQINQPPFVHGFRPPTEQKACSECDLEATVVTIDQLSHYWIKRPLGSDVGTTQIKQSIEKSRPGLTHQLHEFSLGGSNLFGDHFQETGVESNELMQTNFQPIYRALLNNLRKHLKTDNVHFRKDTFLPFFRLLDFRSSTLQNSEILRLIQAIKFPLHFDQIWCDIDWPPGTRLDHSIAFTLPIMLPKAGHGLIMLNAYKDAFTNKNYVIETDPTTMELRQSSISLKTKFETKYYNYTPGNLVLHSGNEFHAVAPLHEIQPDDRRITLQGWGIWTKGKGWQIFG